MYKQAATYFSCILLRWQKKLKLPQNIFCSFPATISTKILPPRSAQIYHQKWKECSVFLWPCEAEENSSICDRERTTPKCHRIQLQLQQKQWCDIFWGGKKHITLCIKWCGLFWIMKGVCFHGESVGGGKKPVIFPCKIIVCTRANRPNYQKS